MGSNFHTTNWSLVLAAAGDDPSGRAALEELCRTYWFPLFAFVRRRTGDPDAAMDLTQGFFADLLERAALRRVDPAAGAFRNFLLASIKNHMSHERGRAAALKRGGGKTLVPLDAEAAERRYAVEPAHDRTPESLFEYHWAMAVLDGASRRLEEELEAAGKGREYRALAPFLIEGGSSRPYRDVAEELGTSEGAVKMAVRRLRQRYGAMLREQVALGVADPGQVDGELRHLLSVVRDG